MINKWFSLALIITYSNIAPSNPKPLVMLNPAGDSSYKGRTLWESYERGAAHQWAKQLQSELKKDGVLSATMSHKPGEQLQELQVASFANRLGVDIFVSLHLYAHKQAKPHVAIYYLLRDPFMDFSAHKPEAIDIIPLYKSHLKNLQNTQMAARKVASVFSQEKYKQLCSCTGPFGIPFRPLSGILAPAIAIEVGICQDDLWYQLMPPCIEAIHTVLEELKDEQAGDVTSGKQL